MLRRPRASQVIATVLAVAALRAAAAHADVAPPARFELLREKMRQFVAAEKVPSLALAVADRGEIIWEEAFGWADLAARRPATIDTPYSLASISKPITGTALMILVERGLVDLDQPINHYLGDAPLRVRLGDASQATVRRVANHTAGMPLHYQFFYADETMAPPSFAETMRRYGNALTPPGERWHYSNLGFGALDHVIRQVSGRGYAEFIREEVARPLGLERLAVGTPADWQGSQALRYGAGATLLADYQFDHPGASAVYASAHDLCRFGLFHAKCHRAEARPILSDEAIDAMQVVHQSNHGVAWNVSRHPSGAHIVSHDGGMPGVSTTLWIVPERQACAVVLCNTMSAYVGIYSAAIRKLVLSDEPPASDQAAQGESIPTALDARRAGHGDEEQQPAQPATLAESAAWHGHWRGTIDTYQGERSLELKILPTGEIQARVERQLWTLVNDARLDDQGSLRGVMWGDLNTVDTRRSAQYLQLDLQHRGDGLTGAVVSVSRPDARLTNALSHWVRLERVTP